MSLFRIILAIGVVLGVVGPARALDQVAFASRDGTMISGWLARPDGPGPFPAVVALHGCAGLWTASGAVNARESDWIARLTGAGYAVLLPDSFRPRGLKALCNERDRSLTPAGRAKDALGARDWLAQQRFVAPDRVGLIGLVEWRLDRATRRGRHHCCGPRRLCRRDRLLSGLPRDPEARLDRARANHDPARARR